MNKHLHAVISVLALIVISLVPAVLSAQNTAIVPDPPVGKGIVAIKAARMIDGTGRRRSPARSAHWRRGKGPRRG